MNKIARVSTLLVLLLPIQVIAQETGATKLAVGGEVQESVMVTVYNNNYGLVREVRKVSLPVGVLELEFRDVAEQIDPTSVAFKSLTSAGEVSILEQNYRYDLLNPQTLLDKYVGKPITITNYRTQNNTDTVERREGKLLSTNGGMIVLFGEDRIEINPAGTVSVGDVPSNLISRPTLFWLLRNSAAGEQKIETAYLTNEMNWKADYVAVVNADDTKLDLTGWVTLDNRSGAAYRNAKLKLIAGDVQRVQDQPIQLARGGKVAMAAMETQFAEKSFFEYHLYTLDAPTTLANNETKQLSLLKGTGVPVKKSYILDSTPWARVAGPRWKENRKLDVVLEVENKKESNLGIPLPKGKIRVYKADTDGSQIFVGEDLIDHTPRDEKIRLKVGQAFDVVAERTQTDYKQLSDRVIEVSYSIALRNHKDEDIQATIIEHAFGEWEVTKESAPHKKRDSQTLEFTVAVAKNGETTVTYTVRIEQ